MFTFKNLLLLIVSVSIASCTKPPQINEFNVTSSIIEGDTAAITWDVGEHKKITNISLYSPKKERLEGLTNTGKMYVYPYKDESYRLVVNYKSRGRTEKISKSAKITVYEVFMEGSNEIVAGEEGFLEWQVAANADKIWITQYVKNKAVSTWQNVPNKGRYTIKPLKNSIYTLFLEKNGFVQELSHEVKVKAAYFTGTDKILYGETAQLLWKASSLMKSISLESQENAYTRQKLKDYLKSKDKVEISPQATTKYTLILKNQDIETKFVHIVQVVDAMFTGSHVIPEGEEAILSWRASERVDKIWIEEVKAKGEGTKIKENLDSEGRVEVFPQKNTVYRLYTRLKDGTISKLSHYVGVQPPPRPAITNLQSIDNIPKDQTIDFEIFGYERAEYPEKIRLKVLATDARGSFISGLGKDKATIDKYFLKIIQRVEGKNFPVERFEVREITTQLSKPYAMSLALDYSGSMWETTPSLETAIKQFIKNKASEDELSVVKFDDNLVRKVALEKNTEDIIAKSAFDGKDELGGGTALFAGADEGLNAIEKANKNKIMILFTDGMENASGVYTQSHATTALELVKKARKSNTKIYPISFGRGADIKLLDAIAVLTDGKAYNIYEESQILEAYQEFPNIFRNYYEVSYKPIYKEGVHITELQYFNQKDTVSVVGQTHNGDNFDPSTYKTVTANFDPSVAQRNVPKTLQSKSPNQNIEQAFDKDNNALGNMKQAVVIAPQREEGNTQTVALFDFDKSEIPQKYIEKIDKYISYLKVNQDALLEIHGHSDLKGSKKGCIKIAEERANIVKAYFVEKGISENRMLVKSFGRSKPLWLKEKHDWQAKENRRVDILILE